MPSLTKLLAQWLVVFCKLKVILSLMTIETHFIGRMYLCIPLLSFNYQLSIVMLLLKKGQLHATFSHVPPTRTHVLGTPSTIHPPQQVWLLLKVLYMFVLPPIFSFLNVSHSIHLLSLPPMPTKPQQALCILVHNPHQVALLVLLPHPLLFLQSIAPTARTWSLRSLQCRESKKNLLFEDI